MASRLFVAKSVNSNNDDELFTFVAPKALASILGRDKASAGSSKMRLLSWPASVLCSMLSANSELFSFNFKLASATSGFAPTQREIERATQQ